jgi:hypothetical protein
MDLKKKESEKRKREGEANLNKLGLSLNSDLIAVGVIFENLLKSDINLSLLNGVNQIFDGWIGVDINVFAHNLTEPCVFLLAPLLDLKYIHSWTYPLIAVNKSTLQTALSSRSKVIYCFTYNEIEKIDDSRVRYFDKLDLIEIIKLMVGDLKVEKSRNS